MRFAFGALLGASVVVAAAGQASAADVAMPALPGPIVVAAPADPGFNWNRFYVGVQAGAWIETDPFSFYSLRATVVAGRNIQLGDRVVAGVEGVAGAYEFTDIGLEFWGLGRLGVILGERALLYGIGGAGWDDGDWAFLFGGGAELAIGRNIAFRTEVQAERFFGDPGIPYIAVSGGLSFYFGN